jgi:hypothetical protein
MLRYDNGIEIRRSPRQRHIEVCSPKLRRCLTLLARDAHHAWLLETGPRVHSFCARPAYVVGEAGRLIGFWVDRCLAKCEILGGVEADAMPATLPSTPVLVLRRADLVAAETRVNWSRIIPYRISFGRDTKTRLQDEIFARGEKPGRLEHLETAFQPIDVSVLRASVSKLLSEGRVVAPSSEVAPLRRTTLFRRWAS